MKAAALTILFSAGAAAATELHSQNQGDNGMINNNAHNTWDMVFNSPVAIRWLLQQRKEVQ